MRSAQYILHFLERRLKQSFAAYYKQIALMYKNFIVQFDVHFYAIGFGSIKSKTKCLATIQ